MAEYDDPTIGAADPEKELAEQHILRYGKLKAERSVWESHWQELAHFILPRKDNINQTDLPGQKKGQRITDSTAIQANDLLAASLHGALTNPSSTFFDLTTGVEELDEDDDIRKWLQKTARKMHHILNNSNFQTEIHEMYLDLGCFGTAPLSMEEDDDTVIRFASRSLKEVVVDENNKGQIDTVYRCFTWKARQIVQEFGIKNVGEDVQKMYQDKSQEDLEIIHCVYPRENIPELQAKNPKGFKFASVYIIKKFKKIPRESGFREFPYAVPRWTKQSGEVYGRSPGMKCLPDTKMANKMKDQTIQGAEKTINPPMQAPDDGLIGPVKLTPGGTTYYRSGTTDRIEPIVSNARIDFGMTMSADVQKAIRQAYYVDQFQLNTGPQMTATEVDARVQQMMRLMGPILARQQAEFLRPMIDRLFGIMLRKNLLPMPIPLKLSGKKIDVLYSSLVARAQRQSEGDNVIKTIQTIAPFIQIAPDAMDNFDTDKAVRYVAQVNGLPQDLMMDIDKRDALRKAKDQARQAQIQQMQEQHQADVVQKAGPTLVQASQQKGGGVSA